MSDGRCAVCFRPVEDDEDHCIICENRRDRPAEMGVSNTYAGETDAKRLSRLRCYMEVQETFRLRGDPGGWAITLAGPEAAEVGVLRYMLNWPRDRVLFVDHDPVGLRKAERLWPGVDTYCGDIVDALDFLDGGIGFAHFDFMGHFNHTAQETFKKAGSLLKDKGVAMYTYFRGREQMNKAWHLAQHYSEMTVCRSLAEKKTYKELKDTDRRKLTRSIGYMNVALQLLQQKSRAHFAPLIVGANYQSTSPMGVLAAQKFMVAPKNTPTPRALPPIKGGKNSTHQLRHYLKLLRDNDYDSKSLAAIFNIKETSIPAWVAHATRGTYDKKSKSSVRKKKKAEAEGSDAGRL